MTILSAGQPERPPLLTADNLCFTGHRRLLIRDVSLTLHSGEITAIIGPNGAGKSTLLKLLSGLYPPDSGCITLLGKTLTDWSPAGLAGIRAVMSQQPRVTAPYTVSDIIGLGKHSPYGDKTDAAAIIQVAALTGCSGLLSRRYHELSGGEQQRVQLARALIQLGDIALKPRLLLLDEPTAALDLHHQQVLLRMLRQQVSAGPLSVCCILHDLNLASLYADRIILLHNGAIAAHGSATGVLQAPQLEAVYRAELGTHTHPLTQRPWVFLHP